jgi:hypothetical protein
MVDTCERERIVLSQTDGFSVQHKVMPCLTDLRQGKLRSSPGVMLIIVIIIPVMFILVRTTNNY